MLGFLKNFSISGRYRWVPNRGAVGKIGNDKSVIQSEKSMRRSMLIKVTVDGFNGLTKFRAELEVIIIPRHLKELTHSS